MAITGVGLDHTRILGDTLEAIAEKARHYQKPGRTACALAREVFMSQAAAGVVPTLLVADKPEKTLRGFLLVLTTELLTRSSLKA